MLHETALSSTLETCIISLFSRLNVRTRPPPPDPHPDPDPNPDPHPNADPDPDRTRTRTRTPPPPTPRRKKNDIPDNLYLRGCFTYNKSLQFLCTESLFLLSEPDGKPYFRDKSE